MACRTFRYIFLAFCSLVFFPCFLQSFQQKYPQNSWNKYNKRELLPDLFHSRYISRVRDRESSGIHFASISEEKESDEIQQLQTNESLEKALGYESRVSKCLRKRNWKNALEIWEEMQSENISSDDTETTEAITRTFNEVLSCCSKANKVDQVLDLFHGYLRKRDKVQFDVVTFNTVMSTCVNSRKHWKETLKIYDKCRFEPKAQPDIFTYTIAIRACGKSGASRRNLDQALTLFQIARHKKLDMDVYIYTALMDVLSKNGLWKKALDLLDEMRSEHLIYPNGFTYSVAINACGKGGQWERALELMHQMREKNILINTITYNAAIAALTTASEKSVKMQIKQEMNKEYMKRVLESGASNEESSIDQYTSEDIIKNNNSQNEQYWRKALQLMDQMKKEGVKPDTITYATAIKVCGSAGRWKEALNLFSIMQNSDDPKAKPNRIAYTNAIIACGRSNEYEQSLNLFNLMKADNIQPDLVSYNALLSSLRAASLPQTVFDLWNEMCASDNKRITPDIITVTNVIYALERSSTVSSGKHWSEKSDLVFTEAVERKILFKSNSLDTTWEVDLSKMSYPVAHAALRFVLKSIKANVKETSSSAEKEAVVKDLTLITGTGNRGGNLAAMEEGKTSDNISPIAEETDGNTPNSLREFIRRSLSTEFDPPIYATIPETAAGTIVVRKLMLEKWVNSQIEA